MLDLLRKSILLFINELLDTMYFLHVFNEYIPMPIV